METLIREKQHSMADSQFTGQAEAVIIKVNVKHMIQITAEKLKLGLLKGQSRVFNSLGLLN